MTTNDRTVGRYLRWLLAALALGAGGIHIAVTGEHYDVGWAHGTFFAVVAWLQLSWAVAIVLRPTRRLLVAGALVNAAIIGVWAVSRVWGVPVGPGAWTPEQVTLADILASAFEGGIVCLSLAVLVRPSLATRSLHPNVAVPGIGVAAVAVAVVSTMSLTPSFAAGHSHGSAAGGHDHSAAAGHDHGASAGSGHGLIGVTNAAVGSTPCEKSGPPASAGQVEGGHGHRGPVGWTPIADPATRARFEQETAVAHQVTLQYSTVKDAEAAGYKKVTDYVPCIGAHYINVAYLGGRGAFDYAHPAMILYAGTSPDSQIVGLSYSKLTDPAKAPDAFEGEAPWHKHNLNGGLCIKGGVVVGSENVSQQECDARGGHKIRLDGLWMMHMWVADGWPSSWGLFSSEHPDLGGRLGDINGKPDPNLLKNA